MGQSDLLGLFSKQLFNVEVSSIYNKTKLDVRRTMCFAFHFHENLWNKTVVWFLQIFISVEFKVFNFAIIRPDCLSTVMLELNVPEN